MGCAFWPLLERSAAEHADGGAAQPVRGQKEADHECPTLAVELGKLETEGSVRVVEKLGGALGDDEGGIGAGHAPQHDAVFVDPRLEGDVEVAARLVEADERIDPTVGDDGCVSVEQPSFVLVRWRLGVGRVRLEVGVVLRDAKRVAQRRDVCAGHVRPTLPCRPEGDEGD